MEEYLTDLKERIEGKQMDNIWVMAERVDFKPMKGHTKASIQAMFKENVGQYADKLVSNIQIIIYPNKDDKCIALKVLVYKISNTGDIDKSLNDSWGCKILYSRKSLTERKFLLKDVEQIMRWVANQQLLCDPLMGMSFESMLKELKQKKLRLE